MRLWQPTSSARVVHAPTCAVWQLRLRACRVALQFALAAAGGVPILSSAALVTPEERPSYASLRWEEDYRFLSDVDKRSDPFDQLKFIPLLDSNSNFITLSGQWRLQSLTFDAPGFGLGGQGGHGYQYQRLLIGADWHFTLRSRTFVEVGSMRTFDKRRPYSATDQDRLDIQQMFLDHSEDLAGGKVVGRAGRQEIAFDKTERFLGIRDGPNVRQAFDAAYVSWAKQSARIVAFAGRPVKYLDGEPFDDGSDKDVLFSGARLELTKTKPLTEELNAYVYRYANAAAKFANSTTTERRDSFGLRYAGNVSSVDWDVESVLQTGRFAQQTIRAWAIGSKFGYTAAALGWKPRLGGQLDVGSGDANSSDTTYRVFNPLFPKGAYFNEAALTGFPNVEHLSLSLSLRPSAQLTVEGATAWVGKHIRGDFAYQSTTPIPGSNLSTLKRVGRYHQVAGSHKLNPHLAIEFQLARYIVSNQMKAIGAKDVTYSKLTLNLLF